MKKDAGRRNGRRGRERGFQRETPQTTRDVARAGHSRPRGSAASGRTVSLCMIVRNEESNLARCLRSVAAVVDEMVVVDTGSTDRTVAIAEEFGARVFHYQWHDDFSAAINFALEQASCDWVIRMDGDEALDASSAQELRTLVDGATLAFYLVRILSPVTRDGRTEMIESAIPRLFPAHPLVRYRGAVHEELGFRGEPSLPYLPSTILLHHRGYLDAAVERAKQERNLAIMARMLAERPEDPSLHYYVGVSLQVLGRHEEATRAFRQAIAVARPMAAQTGTNPAYLLTAHAALSSALLDLQRPEDALAAAEEGAGLAPDCAAFHYNRAVALRALGREEDAVGAARRALACNGRCTLAATDTGASGWKAHRLLADVFLNRNELHLAVQHLKAMLRDQPAALDGYLLLGRACAGLGRDGEAEQWLRRGLALLPDSTVLRSALAEICRGRARRTGSRAAALACVTRALELAPEEAENVLACAAILCDYAHLQEARGLYERALELSDAADSAHLGLATLAVQTGDILAALRHAEAIPSSSALYEQGQMLRTLCSWVSSETGTGREGLQ